MKPDPTASLRLLLLPVLAALAGACYLACSDHPADPSHAAATAIARHHFEPPAAHREPRPDPLGQLRIWATSHPHEALDWADCSDHPQRGLIREIALCTIATDHPALAVSLAAEMPLENPALLGNLAQQWAEADLPAACHWVDSLPTDRQRSDLLEHIGMVWAKQDPEHAAGFILSRIPPGPAQIDAAMNILHQWALRDPEAAHIWATHFPAGGIRDQALAEIQGANDYHLEPP